MTKKDPYQPVLERVEDISMFHALAAGKMDLRVTAFFFDGKTEGFARVYYDPSVDRFAIDFTPRLLKMDIDTQAFVLMHEVEHVLRGHMTRPKLFTARRWNIAGDCCINNDLIDDFFSVMRLSADLVGTMVTKERFNIDTSLETIEEVYKALPPDPDLEDMVPSGSITSDDCASNHEGSQDANDGEGALEDLVRELRKEEGRGGHGEVPTRFKDLLAPEHKKKLDWQALLREAFGRVKPMPKPAFSKINMRKWASHQLIAPGSRLPREPRVFVGCDTSGSVVGALPWFLVELENCIKDLGMPVDMCFTESGEKHGWLTGVKSTKDEAVKKATDNYVGGASHFDWVYPKLYKSEPRYDLVILLTDCYNTPPQQAPHGPGGRTVILNVGSRETQWAHCEIYHVDIEKSEM